MLKLIPPRFAAITSGLLVAVTGFFALSQVPTSSFFPSARLQYGPHPRDFVRIVEGTPFVVPQGKILVVTAIGSGSESYSNLVSLTANGTVVADVYASGYYSHPASIAPTPAFLAFQPGEVLAVSGGLASLSDGRAWGYLAEQAPSLPAGTMRPTLEFQPHPQDALRINEGTPYVVPPGMLCVVTALGLRTSAGAGGIQIPVQLSVNGTSEVLVNVQVSDFLNCSLAELPRGLVLPAGSTLSVECSSPIFDGLAQCYLAVP